MCPFVDQSDARCATHLTLANISRAFAHCADEYTMCPVYQQLIAELDLVSDGCAYAHTSAAASLLAAS